MGTGYTTDEKWSTRVVYCGSCDDGLPDPDALGASCIQIVSEDGCGDELYFLNGAWREEWDDEAAAVDAEDLECCYWYVPPSGDEIVDEMRRARSAS